jgi:sigma-B regulation protein RsbU (phosphoserine phosphatase)
MVSRFFIDPEELKDIYETAPCGLLVLISSGQILYVNQVFSGWLNSDSDHLLSKNFTDLLNAGGKFYYQLFVQPSLKMHQSVKEIDFSIETSSSSFSCLFSASVIKIK